MRVKGLEPPRREALDPKSSVSTNFTTPAKCCFDSGANIIDFLKNKLVSRLHILGYFYSKRDSHDIIRSATKTTQRAC